MGRIILTLAIYISTCGTPATVLLAPARTRARHASSVLSRPIALTTVALPVSCSRRLDPARVAARLARARRRVALVARLLQRTVARIRPPHAPVTTQHLVRTFPLPRLAPGFIPLVSLTCSTPLSLPHTTSSRALA